MRYPNQSIPWYLPSIAPFIMHIYLDILQMAEYISI